MAAAGDSGEIVVDHRVFEIVNPIAVLDHTRPRFGVLQSIVYIDAELEIHRFVLLNLFPVVEAAGGVRPHTVVIGRVGVLGVGDPFVRPLEPDLGASAGSSGDSRCVDNRRGLESLAWLHQNWVEAWVLVVPVAIFVDEKVILKHFHLVERVDRLCELG